MANQPETIELAAKRPARRGWAWWCVLGLVAYSCVAQRGACRAEPLAGTDHYGWVIRLAEDHLPWEVRGWNDFEWNGANFFYFYGFLPHLVAALLVKLLWFVPPLLVFNGVIIGAGAGLPVTVFLWARRQFGSLAGVMAAAMSLAIVQDPGGIKVTYDSGFWPNAFGLMMFPLAMYAFARFRQEPTGRSAVLLALLANGPLFGHVFVGFICWLVLWTMAISAFIASLLGRAVGRICGPQENRTVPHIYWTWLVLLAGMLASAFWWGPMFLKHPYVRTASGGWMDTWFDFLGHEKANWVQVAFGNGLWAVWGLILAGFAFLAWQRRWDLLAGAIMAVMLAGGHLLAAVRSLRIEDWPGMFMLRAHWRAYAPAKLMIFVALAGLLAWLWRSGGWRRGCGVVFGLLAATIWIGPQYAAYWRRTAEIGPVSPKWRADIDAAVRLVAGQGRVCVDHTAEIHNMLWMDHALAAAGVPSITGCVGEMSMCENWFDSMTHLKLGPEAFYNRARLCAVSHIVAVGPAFKARLAAEPDRYERIARVGGMEVFRMREPPALAVATKRPPVALPVSVRQWQDIMRRHWGLSECPLLIRDGRSPPAPASSSLLDSPTVPLDEASALPFRRLGPGWMTVDVPEGAAGAFIKESYFPNFRAWLNGRPTPIFLAAPNMMYVPVTEAGRLEIRFITDAADWGLIYLSIAAVAATVLAARRLDKHTSLV